MTVDPAMFLPFRPGAGEGRDHRQAAGDGFARMLAAMDPALAEEAAHTAPLSPRIGSRAQGFDEQALVLQTALPATVLPTAVVAPPVEAGETTPVDEVMEAVARHLEDRLGQPGEGKGADVRDLARQSGPLAALRAGLAGWRPAALGDAIAQSRARPALPAVLAGPGAPSQASHARGKQPAEASARSSAAAPPRAAAQTPFSALLLVQDDGLVLVVRAPALSLAERDQLHDRIADLFSRQGLPMPALRIAAPMAGSNLERNA